jgi:hypothetical protein
LNNFSEFSESNNKKQTSAETDKLSFDKENLSGSTGNKPGSGISPSLNIQKPEISLKPLNVKDFKKLPSPSKLDKTENIINPSNQSQDQDQTMKLQKPGGVQKPDITLKPLNTSKLKDIVDLSRIKKPENISKPPGLKETKKIHGLGNIEKPEEISKPENINETRQFPESSKEQKPGNITQPLDTDKTAEQPAVTKLQRLEESLNFMNLRESAKKAEQPALPQLKPEIPLKPVESITAKFANTPKTKRFFEVETFYGETYKEETKKDDTIKSIVIFVLTMTVVVFLMFIYLKGVSQQVEGDEMKLNVTRRPDGTIVIEQQEEVKVEIEDNINPDDIPKPAQIKPQQTPVFHYEPVLSESERLERHKRVNKNMEEFGDLIF